ncbi:MAG: hypothetical protein NXY57DRAFT_1117917 [Lentinula lateritia]|nr:MAG: hypothetical protein NXY57DRAFT_1117917 [Lentinula lateritia]
MVSITPFKAILNISLLCIGNNQGIYVCYLCHISKAVNNLLCQMFMCWRIWVCPTPGLDWHSLQQLRTKFSVWKDQRIFAVPLIFFIILLAISAVVYAIMGSAQFKRRKQLRALGSTSQQRKHPEQALIFALGAFVAGERSPASILALAIYFISSCLLTTIMQFMVLISVIAWPNTEIWVGLFAVLSKFYFNSLLVTLNSRSPVDNQPVASTEIPLQFISGGQSNPAVINFQSQTSQVQCNGPGIVVGIDDVIEVVDDTGEKLGSV